MFVLLFQIIYKRICQKIKKKLYFKWSLICVFFRGVVAVTMDLLKLDINQCPDEYHTPNAFKDTHKCDKKTSYVSQLTCLTSKITENLAKDESWDPNHPMVYEEGTSERNIAYK